MGFTMQLVKAVSTSKVLFFIVFLLTHKLMIYITIIDNWYKKEKISYLY